jgi:UDP-glucose 4-epimerase
VARIAHGVRVPAGSGVTNVLVTGGTGFLGRYVAEHLHREGLHGQTVSVTVLARDRARMPQTIAGACRVLECGIDTIGDMRDRLAEFDYVFHLAAEKDFFGGRRVFDSNLRGTRALVDALKGSRRLKRIVFASSMGAVDRAPADDCSRPLDEKSEAHPMSWYGKAKLACEDHVRTSGLPYSIIRLPWCYGPGMSEKTHIRALMEMVRKAKPVVQFDWPGRISILDAAECARVFAATTDSEAALNQTFFVSDGKPIRFGDLFREMGQAMGRPAGRRAIPRWAHRLAFISRRWLPFTVKCLLFDALVVDDSHIRNTVCAAAPRQEGFLIPLSRSLQQRQPEERVV